jgi:hypothetical protein
MTHQMSSLDHPPVEIGRKPTKRKPAPQPQREETIHQTLVRYAREAAEIRRQLKADGKLQSTAIAFDND